MRIPKKAVVVLALVIAGALALTAAGRVTLYQQKQTPPIKLGTSGGNIYDSSSMYCCSGTLGSLVAKNGTQYILSNSHVLALSGQATGPDPISQPGLVDTNCSSSNSNLVATFSTAAPLGSGSNVDAAIAQTLSGMVDTTGAILGVGVPANTIATPQVNMGVAKAGRTTGLTCDTIDATDLTVNVQYETECGGGSTFIIGYTNQVLINGHSFSGAGDSGSLIVSSATAQPVALLFAGSSSSTIANPIGQVASKLGVTFVGDVQHTVSCGTKKPRGRVNSGSFSRALYAKERHAPQLMQDEAIMAVGVGADDEDPTQAVVVIVAETGRQLRQAIPAQLDGVKTKVLLSDKIRAYGWNEPQRQACGHF